MTFPWAVVKTTARIMLSSPKTGAMVLLLWAWAEGVTRDPGPGGVNTALLAGALALLGWSLVTNVQQNKKLEEIIAALAGYKGSGGLISDVKELKKAKDESLSERGRLQGQIEEISRRVGLPTKPRGGQ